MMSARSTERERPFCFDPDDPEYIKDLQRPAAIKEDLTEMERRKRVQQILESKSFCTQLEGVIKHEFESTRSEQEHLKNIQRLSELTFPNGAMSFANIHSVAASGIPIADLKGSDKYSVVEKVARNKLASLYRLVDLFQWSQGIYNHITLRLPGEEDHILINPFGLLYHEVTASSLVKVNLDGEIVDSGSTQFGINHTGFALHAAIHRARPDVQCIVHMHTAVVSAVASMKCGLLPLCHEAMVIGPVAYHEYQGIDNNGSLEEELVKSLDDKKVMLLRNHGFVVCGSNIEEAVHLAFHTVVACETQILMYRGNGTLVMGESLEEAIFIVRNLVTACDNQVRAAKAGIENLIIPDQRSIERAQKLARNGGPKITTPTRNGKDNGQWKVGELEWEAWMRVLDHAGFRTGHIYRQPGLRPKSNVMTSSMLNNNDVAIPPATTSVGLVDESDMEALAAHRINVMRKEQEKSRWMNSPNAYQKIEILETGTHHPKKITKWIQDPSSTSANCTPVKINSPHQFSPISVNAKEFKDKQKTIKENRRAGQTSAGPTSQILDGVTYEEISRIKPDVDGLVGQTDRVVFIGTASKGIIDRQHQHNAQVYRQLYAPNPFACETDEGIKRYFEEVEQKSPNSRTASSSARDKSADRSDAIRTPSPFEEDPGADTASLMQAVRAHRSSERGRTSASMECIDAVETSPAVKTHTNVDISPRASTLDTSQAQSHSRLDDTDFVHPQATSTPIGSPVSFERAKSERFSRTKWFGNTSARSTNATMSEDEAASSSDRKKKKKKGFFSFMKKKDKSTTS